MYYAEIIEMPEHTSIQIQAMLREMDVSMRKHRKLKESNPGEFLEKVKQENSVLEFNYSVIFYMHLDGKLDSTFFEMLKLKRKMELGELTEDEASKIVGQQLFDRYVAPVVNSTPVEKPLSYSEFYEQFNKKD
ncbi:MAG: hypothetical protein EB127_03360 [Alphaproteobacteria bacterium]|jgi:hypothetical protein|nr:hypothetical protein [Alphaproteobacteria bacterium]